MNFHKAFSPRIFLAAWMTVGCCAVAGQPVGKKAGPATLNTHVDTSGDTTTSEPPPGIGQPKR